MYSVLYSSCRSFDLIQHNLNFKWNFFDNSCLYFNCNIVVFLGIHCKTFCTVSFFNSKIENYLYLQKSISSILISSLFFILPFWLLYLCYAEKIKFNLEWKLSICINRSLFLTSDLQTFFFHLCEMIHWFSCKFRTCLAENGDFVIAARTSSDCIQIQKQILHSNKKLTMLTWSDHCESLYSN